MKSSACLLNSPWSGLVALTFVAAVLLGMIGRVMTTSQSMPIFRQPHAFDASRITARTSLAAICRNPTIDRAANRRRSWHLCSAHLSTRSYPKLAPAEWLTRVT